MKTVIAMSLLALALAACGDSTGSSGTSGGGSGGESSTDASSSVAASSSSGSASAGSSSSGSGGGSCEDTDLEEQDLGEGDDPEAGDFTLDEALDGLPPGDGPLRAVIDTDFGAISCELLPDVAPTGVANFVGLARGRRPFLDLATDRWVVGRRFYDGLLFHRVIDDFVAQGGDPLGTGFGDPGYSFDDEIGEELSHVPGTLSYANAGADTNGSQFFIVAEEPADFLDGGFVIFGLCEPIAVVQAITEVPTSGKPNDRPLEDVVMHEVRITRCAE
jgi:peptidyl-prolyl cis-trans isomerase A (cyclophilin A)